ncbi:MAG: rRNA pseudouridine synthase [Planctomycetaceae bacterium]|nr:rRNA pseudouridine synthase [Planctomycetaceae bacterium]
MAAKSSSSRSSTDRNQPTRAKAGAGRRAFKQKGSQPDRGGRGGSKSNGGKTGVDGPRGAKRSGRLKKRTPVPAVDSSTIRLQKFLAAAGVGSRRDCELLIVEGRIEVDNQVVTELGTRIDPEKNVVTYDGQRVRTERLQYFMLNKPQGVLSTAHDPSGRPRVVDLISSHQRVYNVGRLDMSSEGLILVTNDGTLAQYLTHPSFGVEKVYQVIVRGVPKVEDLETLKHGVHLMEGVAKVKDVEIRRRHKDSAELLMVLDEGKNREIRRMLAKIGHKVLRLIRVAIGPLALGDLPAGSHRRLTYEEVQELKEWAERVAKGQAPRTVLRPKAKKALAARTEAKQKRRVGPPREAESGMAQQDDQLAKRASPSPGSASPGDRSNINPVATKISSGRPIHLEDVQRSKELRRVEFENRKSKGKRPPSATGKSKDRGRNTTGPATHKASRPAGFKSRKPSNRNPRD